MNEELYQKYLMSLGNADARLQNEDYKLKYYDNTKGGTGFFVDGKFPNTGRYNVAYGIDQEINPYMKVGYERFAMPDIREQSYLLNLHEPQGWGMEYKYTNGDGGRKDTYTLQKEIGKGQAELGYQRGQDGYRGYNLGYHGKVGKYNVALEGNRDNMGNKRIYASMKGRF